MLGALRATEVSLASVVEDGAFIRRGDGHLHPVLFDRRSHDVGQPCLEVGGRPDGNELGQLHNYSRKDHAAPRWRWSPASP